MNLVSIGYGNFVSSQKLVAVISPDSAPVKRLVSHAKEKGMLIDATYGRKTNSVVVMSSDHVILSAVKPASIGARFERTFQDEQDEPVEMED